VKLEGKSVLVTGGSGAIGSAICNRLADCGARIGVHYHSRRDSAQAVATGIEARGGQAFAVGGDLRDRVQADSAIAEVLSVFGVLDALICTSGASVGGGRFEALTEHDWRDALDSNLMSSVYSAQAAIPHLVHGGHIVFTSSVRGLPATGREGLMAYSAAKAALINLTSTLAKDLGPAILVNAVAPGFVWTKNYESMSSELRDSFTNATILQRFIQPDEVAETYEFLLKSDVITGQTIVVDGGFALKMA
jgi:NAD(P)-dependent dehydrogenase (short-subunit alcohol dehydrogenase family)